MKYIGLDVSNKSTAICIVSERGDVVEEFSVNTKESSVAKGLKKYRGSRCVVEASPLAETICSWVEGVGISVDILDTRQAKVVTATKKKTDRLDARKLAQLCRTGWYGRVYRKSGEARNLRSYLTARMQLVKSATGLLSSIRGILRAHGLVVPAGSGEKFEKNVRDLLKKQDSMLQCAIEPLLCMWKELEEQAERMYRELDRQISRKNPAIKRLITVPGVGPVTATAFIATIDDPRRFSSGEQVSSYLGLVPSVYQSGDFEVKGRITRHGDNLLRWLLVEAATTLLTRSRKSCPLKEWGLKLQEKKGFGKARVAVARKLACLLHHLWMTEQEFEFQEVTA